MPQITSESTPTSMWQVKPWWCQPWSIVLTGVAIPTGSWLLLHRLWITLPVMGAIALWWLLFLVLVPAQYVTEMKAQSKGIGTQL
ncbi:MAG: DUF6737 family protein [Cyanobacteria bacterium P01_D01_bin.1]